MFLEDFSKDYFRTLSCLLLCQVVCLDVRSGGDLDLYILYLMADNDKF